MGLRFFFLSESKSSFRCSGSLIDLFKGRTLVPRLGWGRARTLDLPPLPPTQVIISNVPECRDLACLSQHPSKGPGAVLEELSSYMGCRFGLSAAPGRAS